MKDFEQSAGPRGFAFASVGAGFRYKDRDDLGLILSHTPAAAAGVFTTNLYQAAPVVVCRQALERSKTARAVLVNSGLANACTGDQGLDQCRASLDLVGRAVGLSPGDILPASTGVIGPRFKDGAWLSAAPRLAESLGRSSAEDVARAMMTTDKTAKLVSRAAALSGGEVRVLGLAKGAGMISPNMATMLAFVICDAGVDPDWWRLAICACAGESFNRITVDGDMSTNDTFIALANGASGVCAQGDADRDALRRALAEVCRGLAYMIVRDAEGGTKVARIVVSGAKSRAQAELAARAVGNSPLVKTALFGCDPNWGRVVCAVGRSGADFDPARLTLRFGEAVVFRDGGPVPGDLDLVLKPIMSRPDVDIHIDLAAGTGEYELLASDLSRDYVSINADYRS
ncbi:MAG: bifunctional glutamate N-acetyltransferase/amino-acid acetyltransferase ArgJ [Desulfovibrionaceae bacterium]|nr:bifunctional glutamate N-acetyltransferase/amino-acid acetyltransferase ArgJ [Desulfovibrionaceae bacterium]